jgi:hypothetical protein
VSVGAIIDNLGSTTNLTLDGQTVNVPYFGGNYSMRKFTACIATD